VNAVARAPQNLSAGIILAAVASELFPLLGKSGGRTSLGLALGFGAGLCTVFGVEKIASAFEARRNAAICPGAQARVGCATLTRRCGAQAKQNAEGDSQHTEEALELLNVSHREHIKARSATVFSRACCTRSDTLVRSCRRATWMSWQRRSSWWTSTPRSWPALTWHQRRRSSCRRQSTKSCTA
jgi:hypothetical protein